MGYNRNLDRQNAVGQTWWQSNWSLVIGGFVAVILALGYAWTHIPEAKASDTALAQGTVITSIYWSDGDSGKANKHPFRLSDWDAPETGGVGAAIGGAKCEAERAQGFEAKAFMVTETKGGELVISENLGQDRYGRWVVSISDAGRDLGELGQSQGVLRSWRHKGKKALEPRPKWCEE